MVALDIPQVVKYAREIVLAAEINGELNTLTHRIVRREIEKQLSLDASTLDAPHYRKPLKSAITEAVEEARRKKQSTSGSMTPESHEELELERTTVKAESSTTKRSATKKKEEISKQFKSAEFVSSDVDDGQISSKKSTSARKKRVVSPEPDAGENSETMVGPPQATTTEKSDSELSILIDERPKKRKSLKSESKSTGRGSTRKGKSVEPPSKDEETIKRLKSLVVACGIRKVWSKVFEGMDKPSQQIRKLKEMLSDLGMKGRFSLEQAKAIREKRELAQELEDVQSFEKAVVGKKRGGRQSDSEEDEDYNGSPGPKRRKVPNARQSIMAFLQNQSESE